VLTGFTASLRSFQASLVSGAMLIFVAYVIFSDEISDRYDAQTPLTSALRLSSHAPLIALLFLTLLVGSLYTTALEGLVDYLQRRYLAKTPKAANKLVRRLWEASAPLSKSAESRLRNEAEAFFLQLNSQGYALDQSRHNFTDSVVRDTLWMEGKLVGTPIAQQYSAFRSEGEIEVSTGVLLAPAVASLTISAGLDHWTVAVATTFSAACAVKLIDYGFYYYRRANSLIAHHVADGSILTPTMESTVRGELALRPPIQ
jgi:hypothetical protein